MASIMLMFLLALIPAQAGYYEGLRRRYTDLLGYCPRIECVKEMSYMSCAYIQNYVLYLCPDCCKNYEGSECFLNNAHYGMCVGSATRFEDPESGFPGDRCEWDSDCHYGLRRCSGEKICEGVKKYGKCRASTDCVFQHFCDQEVCMPVAGDGGVCFGHDGCARGSLCFMYSVGGIAGVCVKVLSLGEGTQIIQTVNGKAQYFEGAEKLCSTGWINKMTGKCGKLVKSLKKGDGCSSDYDCVTDEEGVYGVCRCGFTKEGSTMCDLEGGDEEWLDALGKYRDYVESTGNCHNAAVWSECRDPELHKAWRCAEARAMNYLERVNNPECVSALHSNIPAIAESQRFCYGALPLSVPVPLLFLLFFLFLI